MEIDLIEYEKYLLKMVFINEEARDKIFPYLLPEYFDEDFNNREIVKIYLNHFKEYGKHPSPKEFVARITNEEVFNTFKLIMNYDTSSISDDFIKDQASEFFKQKMLMQHTIEIVENVKKNGTKVLTDIPDKIRDALAFSFDTNVGLEIFENGEALFDSLHITDEVIPTGLKSIDEMIKGGFHNKTLNLFIAPTNMGKSLVKCSLAANALLHNKNVLYVTLEMSEAKISERIIANLFDLELSKIDKLNKEDFLRLHSRQKERLKGRLIVKEYPTKGANTNTLRNLLKELDLKKHFKPDIIFIDYLGIMNTNSKYHDGNTNTLYKVISEELRGLAVEFDLPIVSANQTNRSGMNVSDFDLTEVADSFGQTMTADVIIGINQTPEMNEQGFYIFKMLKNRYGGRIGKVLIKVDYNKMRITDAPEQSEMIENIIDEKTEQAQEILKNSMSFNRRKQKNNIIDFE